MQAMSLKHDAIVLLYLPFWC